MRLGPLWQTLDAELDRCWASQQQSPTEDASAPAIEDSWDQSDAEYSATSSTSTLENFGVGGRSVDTLWPLAARTAGFSSTPGPQAWLQDLSQVGNTAHLMPGVHSLCNHRWVLCM